MYAMTDTRKDSFAWVEWIETEREKRGWSQSDLAREAGLTRQTINDYEGRRRANPDPKVLVKISLALGYSADHLQRVVGILPLENETSDEVKQIIHEVEGLSKEEQREYLSYLRWMKNQRKRK